MTEAHDHTSEQAEVIAFLGRPSSHPSAPANVDRHETHGAIVFLAGGEAYKIKRAVKYDYLDFSTLERRRAVLEREIEINRQHAPALYIDIVAITRQADGSLALAGAGMPVEYALHMRRFDQKDLLGNVARRGELTPELARALADVVGEGHRRMPSSWCIDAAAGVQGIIDAVGRQLLEVQSVLDADHCRSFRELALHRLDLARDCLQRRAKAGFVRRCHGDLHLDNVVLVDGRPTLFDALEFDDDLATIDTLYDLAFLLMDIEHLAHRRLANVVLNRYLWGSRELLDHEGLVALPLFLGLRSAIRAMTRAQRLKLSTPTPSPSDVAAAGSYMVEAIAYLRPPAPRLVAVGGLSGTGKTTLAAELAWRVGPSPGALHVRTDLERKLAFGVEETSRLPAESYTADAAAEVYHRVALKAQAALSAGHAVVVDGTFLSSQERAEVEALAVGSGLAFDGIWLDASPDRLIERVAGRIADASDATPEVVRRQLERDVGTITWHRIDAGGGRDTTLAQALVCVGLGP